MDKLILHKLQQQTDTTKTILFVDFDGTVFTTGVSIIKAPWYNRQTSGILKKYSLPLILVTGRPDWGSKAEIETKLLGLSLADGVITGAGTIIYFRNEKGKLIKDHAWDNVMKQSTIVWKDNTKELWNRKSVIEKIDSVKDLGGKISVLPPTNDTYLIRLNVKSFPVEQLHQLVKTIENLCLSGIKVVYTEKLLQKNTTHIFSGDILILPEAAGKENATMYVLEKLTKSSKDKFHAYCFGDASIDIDFLTLKNTKNYTCFSYGVHMTPLAKKMLEEKRNSHIHILNQEGPQTILRIVKQFCHPELVSGSQFSPAQNSKARVFLKPFEVIFDSIIDKNKTPNEISFMGLELVKKGIDEIYDSKNLFSKIKGLWHYNRGNLADILDGIRARRQKRYSVHNDEVDGQLVDVFCDRAKEFYQLYRRAEKRDESYQILLTAISCILPSIARAQAEIYGITVPEQDAKGGAMFARTRKLFLSLFFDTIGLHKQSLAIDKTIYGNNMATFENRLSVIPSVVEESHTTARSLHSFLGRDDKEELTIFQHKALERFLLLVQILQEENEIIEEKLKNYPEFLEEYKNEFQKQINEYLNVKVEKLREEWKIKDFELSLKI